LELNIRLEGEFGGSSGRESSDSEVFPASGE
jgi:hypothetical protein